MDNSEDVISRAALLKDLKDGHAKCIANANNKAQPEVYRKMMEHFAEAGRQIIERLEEFPALVFTMPPTTPSDAAMRAAALPDCPLCMAYFNRREGRK